MGFILSVKPRGNRSLFAEVTELQSQSKLIEWDCPLALEGTDCIGCES